MPSDPHERARLLSDEVRVSGISPDDEAWLRAHVAACAECARHEETTKRIVQALSGFSFASGQPVQILAGRRRPPAWRWALAAAALVLLAAAPIYRSVREARRERADNLLLEGVEARVSRTVPRAMEPLVQPQGESR
jgi:hypothetical protein